MCFPDCPLSLSQGAAAEEEGAAEGKAGGKGGGRKGRGGRGKDPPATVEKLDSAMESYWGNGKADAASGDEEVIHSLFFFFFCVGAFCAFFAARFFWARQACALGRVFSRNTELLLREVSFVAVVFGAPGEAGCAFSFSRLVWLSFELFFFFTSK